MINLAETSTLINIVYLAIMLATIVGGIVSYRAAMHRTTREIEKNAGEVQERVINALKTEIDSLKDKVTELEKENTLHKQTLGLIKAALRRRGLSITIDGDLVTIEANGTSHTGRIQGGQGQQGGQP